VTIFFWVIKVLCTTVDETASDFLNVNMGLGLRGTSVAAGALLLAVLFVQLRSRKYVPAIYWPGSFSSVYSCAPVIGRGSIF
jgi:uncharacterized membrane-anchored protein